MGVLRILGYFLQEAATSLRRSWKVSLLAVVTIAMSIFIGGIFLLLGDNTGRVIDEWRREARIVVYLHEDASEADSARVRARITATPWVVELREIPAIEARSRFEQMFPSVQGLLESWEEEPFPFSFEVGFDSEKLEPAAFEAWSEGLGEDPAVLLVDDDRDWVRQLDAFVAILRGLGLVVGVVLLGAAVFTISSVIRLTAYLYRDEIAVMRLVGATEFYIRGPFYFEGLIQGFLGGIVALSGLYGAYLVLDPGSSTALLGTVLVERFLSLRAVAMLLSLATLAGFFGAVMSLRREVFAAN